MENTSLNNKVIILNGFSHEEIAHIMKAVKGLFEKPRDLIFAKTTKNSLEMKLKDLIEDISEDHAYLMANPPNLHAQSTSNRPSEVRMKKVNLNLPTGSSPSGTDSLSSAPPSKDESTASDL